MGTVYLPSVPLNILIMRSHSYPVGLKETVNNICWRAMKYCYVSCSTGKAT